MPRTPKELISLLVTILPMLGMRRIKASTAVCKLQATVCSESIRHLCSIVCIHSTFLWIVIYCFPAAFSTSSVITSSYVHKIFPWLDGPWRFVEELQTWLTWVEKWSKGDASRELEIISQESRERRKFSLIALLVFKNYHHNGFKFNLIYNIIRNQPTTLCLHQILRFQAHCYLSAPALLLIIHWCPTNCYLH